MITPTTQSKPSMTTPKTKAEIICDAERLLAEIRQIFTDADHWNKCVRKNDEPFINPDPDDALKKRAAILENFIAVNKVAQ